MGKLQFLMLTLCKAISPRGKSPGVRSKSPHGEVRVPTARSLAPHPVQKGKEAAVCPITGLSPQDVEDVESQDRKSAAVALAALQADPDIAEERVTLQRREPLPEEKEDLEEQSFAGVLPMVPLSVASGAHRCSPETQVLVRSVGLPALLRFTTLFYKRCFSDHHVDKFLANHEENHAERFAKWVVEKFGDGAPWTEERRTRPKRQMLLGRERVEVAYDRSSAHYAAWHSPKREAHKWGEHFKVDDARVWMRLHFWAAREVGLFHRHQAFMDYYVRFIAHFISVYSSKAPPFTRDSVRWSADPQNIERYLAAGHVMADVIDRPIEQAMAELPLDERLYTGSRHPNPSWPYAS